MQLIKNGEGALSGGKAKSEGQQTDEEDAKGRDGLGHFVPPTELKSILQLRLNCLFIITSMFHIFQKSVTE